jgi:hypothetical protein
MKTKSLRGSVLAAIMMVALVASAQAQTQPAPEGDKPAKAKPKPKKAAKSSSKATFISGSGETPAQRVARLKRECKGGVDAGACAGYTR